MKSIERALAVSALLLAATLASAQDKDAGKGKVDGKALYDESRCTSCHGDDGKGQTKMGQRKNTPDMTTAAWQKGITDARLDEVLKNGFEAEHAGKKLKHKALKSTAKAEVDAVRAHIRGFAAKK